MQTFNSIEEVHNHAKKAVGKTVYEINGNQSVSGSKSSVGAAFERWFGKEPDNSSSPDIPEVGVELKATPFKQLIKSRKYSAKERLVLNIINYHEIVNETFEESHFLYKNGIMEIAFYEFLEEVPKDQWTIYETVLFEMAKNPKDFEIIKNDWKKITQLVRDGKAHELSESLTNYLAPCTKGASSKSIRTQPFSDLKAKQRAYSLKPSYMTSILRKYIFGQEKSESIITDIFELKNKDIETIVLERFEPYVGWSIDKLKSHFEIIGKSKQSHSRIAAAILNLNGKYNTTESFDKVEEFDKASIVLKTIYFNEKGKNTQNMSFPAFSFKELSKESWVDKNGEPSAEWHNFLLDTRFLFFVVESDKGIDTFKGVKFFTVPEEDLQGPIRYVWQDTVNKINNGVELRPEKRKNDIRIRNNFIESSDKLVCHVRPHASKADYSENGKYTDELPVPIKWTNKPSSPKYSTHHMTKQSFWFNNDYVKKQVEDLLNLK